MISPILEARLKLNIEIDRPGTLESLEKHLQDSQDLRGPGYFHVVHFDLHGGARMRKGSKFGYLYFSSPGLRWNRKFVAQVQGSLYGPQLLRVCESRRRCEYRKNFRERSIQSVLAMSFKISSNAADIFLRSFYRHLLISRSSFYCFLAHDFQNSGNLPLALLSPQRSSLLEA
jgi:hypothetical protein